MLVDWLVCFLVGWSVFVGWLVDSTVDGVGGLILMKCAIIYRVLAGTSLTHLVYFGLHITCFCSVYIRSSSL